MCIGTVIATNRSKQNLLEVIVKKKSFLYFSLQIIVIYYVHCVKYSFTF